MKISNLVLVLFFSILITSCQKDDDCSNIPDTSNSQVNVTVKRLDYDFFKAQTLEDLYSFFSENAELQNYFFDGETAGTQKVSEMLFPMLTNKAMDTVRYEVENTFGDFKSYEAEYKEAFSLLKYYYPETKDIQINTVNSGMRKDLYLDNTNENIFVSLDYFLGDGATYRPNNYVYVNKRYKPSTILPLTIQYVSEKYNKSDMKDNSLMALMVYYGKAYYFTKKMLPCTADSLIIGYDSMEWEGSEKHIKRIWGVFIERELLYERSHFVTGKYVNERPKTPEIGDKCPGRVGQYLGWKIVKRYMENNPDVTLQELMEDTDAVKIFNKSKFKPEL